MSTAEFIDHEADAFAAGSLPPVHLTGDPMATASLEHGADAQRALVYTSEELLQGRREAWIEHGNQMYRLRLTHAGKLYLTK
ncbi:MAG TPA: hemin uptake protein HemP [Pirellulales bacterium]|jgi:hemin uptake protein HemP